MFKHPTKDELSGFILGKLPLDVSDAVADHLEQCSPCQETIHDLEAHQDTLLHDLRQAPPQSLEIDAECVQAIERVSAALSAVAPALSSSASPLSESIASSADVLSREQFLANLRTSGILDEEHWATLNKLPILAQAVDGAALAGALVECGALTKFQATLICQDKPNGLLFGEYVVLDLLGIGGMGQVFKARHRSMDRIVALKVLAKAAVKSPDAIKRFQREVKAAAKLIHPNIVTAFDAGQQDGVHFLVMEYVPGSDLSALVKRNGPLPVDKVISYIIQVARGLAFAHAKGIVHRDIKPGNLLVDHEGTVRILDMGLARLDGDAASKTAGEELTQTGQVMGTVDYMAPEQAFDTGTADAKADTYSLGCTLYRLLTGQSLFSGDTLIQKILAHREQPIPSLTAACPKVPPQLDAIYQRMVAKQPADRPTMAELIVELETFAKGEPTTTFIVSKRTAELDSKPPATTQAVQQSEERTSHGAGKKPPARKLLAAGAAGFLLLCLGIWVIVRDEDGNEVGRMKVPAGGSTVVTEIRQPSTEAGHKLAGEPNAKSSASPVTVPDPQNSRAFAEFIISHGGKVTPTGFKGADGRPLEIGLVSELPPGDWTIEGISLRTNPLATDDFMSRLAQVPNVQRLYLHDAQLTAVGVRHLCTILTLEELWLTHVPVGDEIMKDVVRLPALKRLVIALTNITDASLGGLKQMPKLTSVDVSGTSVSDEGLRELSNLKQLTYLNFRGTSISDTGLGHLTNLRSLKTLILEKTKVTSAGVQLIRRAIPNCEIELGQSSTEVTSAQQVAAAPLSSSGTPSTGGYTLEFDGNTHVMVDSMTGAIKTPLCLEVWVRPQLPPTAKNTGKVFDFAIPAQTDYFAISVARPEATTDRGYWRVNGKWVETPMQSPLGSVAWGERTHLAASFAENVLRVFLNGKLIQEQPLKNVSLMAPEAHLRLGVGFIGTMEAMRVSQTLRYDGDFTPPQRLEADAGTQILYRFDEGSGAVIRNVIGGGHHGKIIRPKWVSTGTTQPALAGNQKVSLSSPINLLPTLQPATHLFGKWEWVNGAMQATITDKSHDDHLAFY